MEKTEEMKELTIEELLELERNTGFVEEDEIYKDEEETVPETTVETTTEEEAK